MKLKLLFGFAVCVVANSVSAQQNTSGNQTLLASGENVAVYYEKGTCGSREVLFIHVENENEVPVTINWSLWENGKTKTATVNANEKISGTCTNRMPVAVFTEIIPAGKSVNDLHPTIVITSIK